MRQKFTRAWKLMLGDFQFRFGQIEDLATFDTLRGLRAQRPAAVRTTLDLMRHDPVGLLDPA